MLTVQTSIYFFSVTFFIIILKSINNSISTICFIFFNAKYLRKFPKILFLPTRGNTDIHRLPFTIFLFISYQSN